MSNNGHTDICNDARRAGENCYGYACQKEVQQSPQLTVSDLAEQVEQLKKENAELKRVNDNLEVQASELKELQERVGSWYDSKSGMWIDAQSMKYRDENHTLKTQAAGAALMIQELTCLSQEYMAKYTNEVELRKRLMDSLKRDGEDLQRANSELIKIKQTVKEFGKEVFGKMPSGELHDAEYHDETLKWERAILKHYNENIIPIIKPW